MNRAAYKRRIKGMPCCARSGSCGGCVDPHHAGEHPGVSMKADDYTVIPLCRFHHDQWHGGHGPFEMSKEDRRVWSDARIAETQQLVFGQAGRPTPTRLTAEQVLEIRESKDSVRHLALRYGVRKSAIADIRSGVG